MINLTSIKQLINEEADIKIKVLLGEKTDKCLKDEISPLTIIQSTILKET